MGYEARGLGQAGPGMMGMFSNDGPCDWIPCPYLYLRMIILGYRGEIGQVSLAARSPGGGQEQKSRGPATWAWRRGCLVQHPGSSRRSSWGWRESAVRGSPLISGSAGCVGEDAIHREGCRLQGTWGRARSRERVGFPQGSLGLAWAQLAEGGQSLSQCLGWAVRGRVMDSKGTCTWFYTW